MPFVLEIILPQASTYGNIYPDKLVTVDGRKCLSILLLKVPRSFRKPTGSIFIIGGYRVKVVSSSGG